MTIEERLARLERKNRRLTLALVSVGLAAIVAVAMGMAAFETVPDEVTAHKFTLVGNNGKTRAVLKVDEDGTRLSLYDENGKTRAMLMVDKDGTRLSLRDENGKGRAALCVLKDGPNLLLSDKNGKTRVRLEEDRNGASLDLFTKNHELPTIMLYAAEMSHPDMTDLPPGLSPDHVMYGSGFEVFDENSKARARLNINKDGADLTLDDGNSNQVILYGAKDGDRGLILGTAPWDSKAQATFEMTKNTPSLRLLDKNGRVLRSLP